MSSFLPYLQSENSKITKSGGAYKDMPTVTETGYMGCLGPVAEGLGTKRKDITPERKASGPGLRRVTGASRQWVMTAPDTSSQVPCQRFSLYMETKYGL